MENTNQTRSLQGSQTPANIPINQKVSKKYLFDFFTNCVKEIFKHPMGLITNFQKTWHEIKFGASVQAGYNVVDNRGNSDLNRFLSDACNAREVHGKPDPRGFNLEATPHEQIENYKGNNLTLGKRMDSVTVETLCNRLKGQPSIDYLELREFSVETPEDAEKLGKAIAKHVKHIYINHHQVGFTGADPIELKNRKETEKRIYDGMCEVEANEMRLETLRPDERGGILLATFAKLIYLSKPGQPKIRIYSNLTNDEVGGIHMDTVLKGVRLLEIFEAQGKGAKLPNSDRFTNSGELLRELQQSIPASPNSIEDRMDTMIGTIEKDGKN